MSKTVTRQTEKKPLSSSPLPRFRRSAVAPRCLLQDRDVALFRDLWRYRSLTTSQLELLRSCDPQPELRFVSRLTLTRRLKLLFHSKYVQRLARPSITGMQEPIYLLDREGGKVLSRLHGGVAVRSPSQLPKLAALEHLLAINQFRVSLIAASSERTDSRVKILQWRGSGAAKFSVTTAAERETSAGQRNHLASRKVTLIPDSGFTLKTPSLKLFYFLEVDLGSEVSRVLTEKCRAYYAFWQSGGFAAQYSVSANVGFRVLFVAPTARRAATILGAIEKLDAGCGMFWVALQEEITPEHIIRPVWLDAVEEHRRSSLSGKGS